jgi:putative FmdB family regulatory protein
MPRFEFYCPKCDHEFEVDQKLCEVNSPQCPQCGDTRTKKLISSPSFTVKGFNAKNNYGLKE